MLLVYYIMSHRINQASDRLSPMHSAAILNPEILKQLEEALLNAVTTNSQEEINRSSDVIYFYQAKEGYVAYLLEIINSRLSCLHNTCDEILVSSAFAQLKNAVRNDVYEGTSNESTRLICLNDRNFLKNSIIKTSFNICSVSNQTQHYKYMKLLKDIISISLKEFIDIYPQVIESIRISFSESLTFIQLLPVYLNILLGLSNSYTLLSKNQLKEKYFAMIRSAHPYLYEFVAIGDQLIQKMHAHLTTQSNPQDLDAYFSYKRRYEQILYLSIKLFCKLFIQIDLESMRDIVLLWVPIAINRIEYVDPSITLQLNQKREGMEFNSSSIGYKGNDEFNYYHGKKWALKYFMSAMKKVLFYGKIKEYNRSTKEFYNNNFTYLAELFRNIWNYQWPERIQYELLECLESFISRQPRRFAEENQSLLKFFHEELLPPMIVLTQKQIAILEENPLEFKSREELVRGRESIRVAAANAWLQIAKIEYSYINNLKRSRFIRDSFTLIRSWLGVYNSNCLEMRDVGCYLLLKLRNEISKDESLTSELNSLLNRVVVDSLNNITHQMILIRAIELFNEYKGVLDNDVVERVRDLLLCIFRECDPRSDLPSSHLLILLKSCKAVYRLLKFDKCISLDDIKLIISKTLLLAQKTSYDEFIKMAKDILSECLSELHDFATDIANFVRSWFRTYSELDIYSYQNDKALEYNYRYLEIAKGTLSILETLIYFAKKGNQQITQILEMEIASILNYLFAQMTDFDYQCHEEALYLLYAFLKDGNNGRPLSPRLIRLCRICILRLAGLRKSCIVALKKKFEQQTNEQSKFQLKIYLKCEQYRSDGFQPYIRVLKAFISYIKFGESICEPEEILNTILNTSRNDTEHLAYLACRFYSFRNPQQLAEADQGKCFSLLMLIYYYEHHQSPTRNACVHHTVNTFTLNIMKLTLDLYKIRPKFAKYNVQLFCLWLYEVKDQVYEYFKFWQDNEITKFFKEIFLYEFQSNYYGLSQLQFNQQELRCIYGVGYLIRLVAQSQKLREAFGNSLFYEIASYAIQFSYDAINSEGSQTEIDSISSQNEEEEEYYASLMKAELQGYDPENPMEFLNEDGSFDQIESPDEYNEQDYSDEEILECFEENLAEHNSDLPLAGQDELIYLLISLYQFYQAHEQDYWRMISIQKRNSKIFYILEYCNCFKDGSEYAYLRVLCKMGQCQDDEDEYVDTE